MGVGIATGLVIAVLLLVVLRNFLVPDEYEMALGITCAVLAVTVADAIASESGFFAATILGVLLANQRRTTIEPIMRFGEVLNVFVIGALFVLLAARVDLDAVWSVAGRTAALVAILVVIVRPLVVALCTTPSSLSFRERAFAAVAPRDRRGRHLVAVRHHAGTERRSVSELVPVVRRDLRHRAARDGGRRPRPGRWASAAPTRPGSPSWAGTAG